MVSCLIDLMKLALCPKASVLKAPFLGHLHNEKLRFGPSHVP